MGGLLKQTGLLKARTLAKSPGGGGAALTYAATPVAAGAAAGASAGNLACSLLGTVAYSVLSGALAVNSASGALTTTATAGSSGTIAAKVRAQTSTDAVETTIAVPIQAAGGGPTPLAPYMGLVASRSYLPNTKSGSSTQGTGITAHRKFGAGPIKFAYPGWAVQTGAGNGIETASGEAITYNALLEYPLSTAPVRITWGGLNTVTAQPGGDTGLCDATASIPDGAIFRIHWYCSSASAGIVSTQPASGRVLWTEMGEAAIFGTAVTDPAGGPITDGGSNANVYPLAIVGTTTAQTFAVFGDSRANGSQGAPDANGNTGEICPSFGTTFATANYGVGGDRATWFAKNCAQRIKLAAYASHIVVQYGINDVYSGGRAGTDAQLRAALQACYQQFAGKPIIGTTLAPVTTGTFTSAAGQTLDSSNGARTTFNTYLRGVPTPLAAVVDTASAVEDPANLGKWLPNLTPDGLHPNTAGYAAIVSAGVIVPLTLAVLSSVAQVWAENQLGSALIAVLDAANADTAASDGSSWGWSLGSGAYFFQSTGGSQPTLNPTALAGKPAFTFNGTSQFFNGGAASKAMTNGAAGFTIALVGYATAGGVNTFFLVSSIGTSQSARAALAVLPSGQASAFGRRLDTDGGITGVPSASAITGAAPVMILMTYDPTNNQIEVRVNGAVSATASPYASAGAFSATNSQEVILGAATGGTVGWLNGGIARMDLIKRTLTLAEKQKLEGSLAYFTGQQALLPGGHPYKSAPAMV